MIELKGVSKQYLYGAKVLSVIDEKINDGEFVSVLGNEGSGKTTFLKVVAGVLDCDGEVLLNGEKAITKTNEVIMQFEDLALFENKSIEFNLKFPLKIRDIDKAEIYRRITAVAKIFGLSADLKTKVKKASLLERKKTALARLFLREAKVLIMDNPTKGLPNEEKNELLDNLLPLLYEKKNKGVTILFSTNDKEEAVALSDRILVLHNGRVKQFDTFGTIYEQPSNIWAVQALDANYNVMKAKLAKEKDKLVLNFDLEGLSFQIDVEKFRNKIFESYIGKEVLVGIHPEGFFVEEVAVKNGYDTKSVCDEVVFQKTTSNGLLQYTKRGLIVKSPIKSKTVCIVPVVENICLFDSENENSILKMKY